MRTFALVLALPLLAACGEGPAQPRTPTKADVVALLRTLDAAIAAGDTDAALATLHPMPEQAMVEATRKHLPDLAQKEGLTSRAIDRLADKAEFGPLEALWPNRGKFWADKARAKLEECYALKLGAAKVAVHWDGSAVRFIYLESLDAR